MTGHVGEKPIGKPGPWERDRGAAYSRGVVANPRGLWSRRPRFKSGREGSRPNAYCRSGRLFGMQSQRNGGCAKPRCHFPGTETYRGPNGNRLDVCEEHYYKLVSGSGSTFSSIEPDSGPAVGLELTDEGMELVSDDSDGLVGGTDLERGRDYTIDIVDE